MPRKEKPAPGPSNTCLYDIETTNLGADFGIVIAAVVKPLGAPFAPIIFRIDDYQHSPREEDRGLIKALIKELNKYEFHVTYNGIRFDQKFINTRALYHGLETLNEPLHIDLLAIARKVFRMRSKRLANVISFLNIPEKKTAIDMRYWRWAMLGDKRAIDYVVEHCVQDVKSLELVYKALAGYIKSVRRV